MATFIPSATGGPAGACRGTARRAGRLGKARRPVGGRAETSARHVAAPSAGEPPLTGASPRRCVTQRLAVGQVPIGLPGHSHWIVTARYGTASHASADQQRGLIEGVAAAERC